MKVTEGNNKTNLFYNVLFISPKRDLLCSLGDHYFTARCFHSDLPPGFGVEFYFNFQAVNFVSIMKCKKCTLLFIN